MKIKKLSIIILMIVILNSTISVLAENEMPNNSPKPSPTATTTNFIKINETIAIDSNISMILYLDNIAYDNFTFKLYSNNSLEDVNTTDIDLKNYNNEEISFDYCINCSSLKTITLNYKLPTTVEVGDKITFNVELINKDNTEEYVTYRTTVLVIESSKKEDSEEDKEFDKKNIDKASFSRSNISFSGNISGSSNIASVSTKYKGSPNNYLKSITVKGYKLNKSFSKERLTYFVTVPNNVKSLNISTTKESSKASVNISGNTNFSVGVNKVIIKVTSEDGRVKNYRIYVTRLESDTDEE